MRLKGKHEGKNGLIAAASLQDREYPQYEEEQVEHSQEERNGQANRVGHSISHIFTTLDVVDDIAREEGDSKEWDDELEQRRMKNAAEEKANERGHEKEDQAEEEVIAQAGEVTLGEPGIGR